MAFISWLITHIAPIFLVSSPITSYADQIYSMHRNRSSAGFSLDIPLIMLLASILKVFYWFGEHYDNALFFQAFLMIFVQLLLLHIALSNRGTNPLSNKPFNDIAEDGFLAKRPYDFWQWSSSRPYWIFLAYYTISLMALQVFIGDWKLYQSLQGYVALSIEAVLPLPQIIKNHQSRSSKGFRLSVLANWLIGDAMKLSFFFMSQTDIPLAFKMCAGFQAMCDSYLGVQYWMYGEGPPDVFSTPSRDVRLA